jgi:putative membrane protein
MNRLPALFTLLLAAMLLQACKGVGHSDNADTISQTDSMRAVTSNGKAVYPLTADDKQFVINVASSGLKEIELGKIAQQKAENKRVKNFGGMMAKDIIKTLNKLKAIAKSKNITLPATPLAADQKVIDSINKLTGKDFDNAYVNLMITGRQKYVTIFETQVRNSADPDIKSFANKTLTPIKNHLDAIVTIHSSMK